jgi:outer membrane protein OmpA-like peptidoglycan-associated protein
LNAKDSSSLESEIVIEDIETGRNIGIANSNPNTGKYTIVLQKGKKYSFNANLEGFYPNSEFVDLSEISKYTELTKDLYLNPLEVGNKIKLNNLFFDYNKATLQNNSFVELDRLLEIMKTNPKMKILVGGHTDSRGDVSYNKELSKLIAKSVKNYLIDKGIDDSRISYEGYGESVPVAENDTEENMAKNRRVEFEILEK